MDEGTHGTITRACLSGENMTMFYWHNALRQVVDEHNGIGIIKAKGVIYSVKYFLFNAYYSNRKRI